jgi:5'-3' exonuclease
MGVAGFFAWLQRKYPKIVVKATEQGRTSDGRNLPVDATQPNPNFQVKQFIVFSIKRF